LATVYISNAKAQALGFSHSPRLNVSDFYGAPNTVNFVLPQV